MSEVIASFRSLRAASQVFALRMLFLCVILHTMWSGKCLSGVCCKRTGVSHLVVKLHILDRCRLLRLTPYDCSPATYGSVLTVAVRECIIVFGSVSASRPILGVDSPSVLSCCLGAEYPIYRVCVQIQVAFLPACAESMKNS